MAFIENFDKGLKPELQNLVKLKPLPLTFLDFFFLQLCDSLSLRPLVDDNQDSLTLTLSVGSLKGGGKNIKLLNAIRLVKYVGRFASYVNKAAVKPVSSSHQ